jgi:hypothetical protein
MPHQHNHQHHHPHDYNEEDTRKWPIPWVRGSFIYPKGYILPKSMRRKERYTLPAPPLWGVLLVLFIITAAVIALLVRIANQ